MFVTLMLAFALNAQPAPAAPVAQLGSSPVEATLEAPSKQTEVLRLAPCPWCFMRGIGTKPLRVAPQCPSCFMRGPKPEPLRVAPGCGASCTRGA